MNLASPPQTQAPGIIGVAVSCALDASEAVEEALSQIDLASTCFALIFVPDRLDHEKIAEALDRLMPGLLVFGCTTAGQITPAGYEDDAVLIITFPRAHFRCSSTLIKPLNPVSIEDTAQQAKTLSDRFQRAANWNRFAISFADGLSKQEDVLIAALNAGIGDVPIYGGSAGHGLAFDETFVLHNGTFYNDAALLVIVETDLEITGLEFDHFMPTEVQLVVTEAEPGDRVVTEINGAPAAFEYARLVGCNVGDLSPQVFAENPVLVRNHDAWHVRAIQQVVDGDCLAFLSAIESGLVLTLGRGKALLQTLDTELSVVSGSGKEPEFILGFDCVLRRLEIEQRDLVEDASRILRSHRVIGFNTYGEQHCGVHMNQTFVGIAFFPPGPVLQL